jgi:uroporphyrinogen decarboxylase
VNSLERVRKCFAHQEPDRIPIDFGGWLSGIKKSAFERLIAYLGIESTDWQTYDPGEKLQQHFQIDFRRITPATPVYAAKKIAADGKITDEWNVVRVMENEDDQIVIFPLAEAGEIADLEAFNWPDASGKGRYDLVNEQARAIHERGFAVSAQPDVNGVFEQACWLCGFDQILMNMALKPEFISALFERITVLQEQFASNYYSKLGNNAEMIQLGDDFGTQNGTFFSPEMYRESIAPFQKRYHQAIKSGTDAKIFHHSCGSVYRILEDMINTGIEILNPIQHFAAEMDLVTLKKEFGDQLVFHGAIDVQKILPFKSPAEIRDEVKRVIDILAPGGGYVLAPSHNIQGDTPPENIVAMFEAAIEFGGA